MNKDIITKIMVAREMYYIVKAIEDEIKKTVKNIERKILENGNYLVCEDMWNTYPHINNDNRRIIEPKNAYLMEEDIYINDFLKKCHTEYDKLGISNKEEFYPPERDVEKARRKCENILLELAIDIMPNTLKTEKEALKRGMYNVIYREKMLDIILKLNCDSILI